MSNVNRVISGRPAIILLLAFGLCLGLCGPAAAGPPYLTDDPEPTDLHHWEIYNYAQGNQIPGDVSGEAGLDLNYGGAKDLQLTAVIPAGFDNSHWGWGDIELAAKYRFAHQDGPLGLDVSVFPRVFVPTAFDRAPDDRHASVWLPVWAQKDFGKWSVFGGGGYTFNPGTGNRDYWNGGLAVTRQINERLNLGGEIFLQGATETGGRSEAFANLGATLKLTEHWSLLGSAGPDLQNANQQSRYDFYVSLKADY